VNLTWTDNSNNEDGFQLYESTDGVNWAQLTAVGANVTAYSWSGAAPGTSYSFRMTAYNGAGESTPSNTASVTTPIAPLAPSNLAAAAGSGTQVNLTWTDSSNNADGFRVYESTDGVSYAPVAPVGWG